MNETPKISKAEAWKIILEDRDNNKGICAYKACKKPFTGPKIKKYCSHSCRVTAWQSAHRKRLNAIRAGKDPGPLHKANKRIKASQREARPKRVKSWNELLFGD